MRQSNTGNILPFFKFDTALSLQGDNMFKDHSGLHAVGALTSTLIPFQTITTKTDHNFYIADITGALVALITMTYRETATERIYTYNGGQDFTGTLTNCTYYYIRMRTTLGATRAISEKIYVKDSWQNTLIFTNTNDLSRVMYQDGYTQKFYFDSYEDTPIVNSAVEKVISLDGKEITTSARQVEKRVIKFFALDSQLTALERIGLHSSISLFETNPADSRTIENLEFDFEESEDERNLCTFTFDVDVLSLAGCGSNTFNLI